MKMERWSRVHRQHYHAELANQKLSLSLSLSQGSELAGEAEKKRQRKLLSERWLRKKKDEQVNRRKLKPEILFLYLIIHGEMVKPRIFNRRIWDGEVLNGWDGVVSFILGVEIRIFFRKKEMLVPRMDG